MWDLSGKNYNFVQLAALSGATAVMMGTYGRHSLSKINDIKEQMGAKKVFEIANRFHFLHSLALLAIPLVRRPVLVSIMKHLIAIIDYACLHKTLTIKNLR